MNEINYNGTTIRVETITPQLAEIYLGKNTHNRNIRKPVVGKYANDMENGFWNFDGAPIRFADDGTLLDGQHRLHAIIKSNKAIDLLVVRGLKKETQATMDIGSVRQAGHFLQINGVKNANCIASFIRGYIAMENGAVTFYSDNTSDGGSKISVQGAKVRNRIISTMEIVDKYYTNTPLYNEIATFSRSLCNKSYSLMNASVIGAYMCFLHINKKYDILYLNSFFSEILGISNTTNSTCRLLYDKLMKLKTSKNFKINGSEFMACMVKVFNCYVDNIELKKIIIKDDDYNKDFKTFENKISM